jgi:hypothetical protein
MIWDVWADGWPPFAAAMIGTGFVLRLLVTGIAAIWYQWFCTLREI